MRLIVNSCAYHSHARFPAGEANDATILIWISQTTGVDEIRAEPQSLRDVYAPRQ